MQAQCAVCKEHIITLHYLCPHPPPSRPSSHIQSWEIMSHGISGLDTAVWPWISCNISTAGEQILHWSLGSRSSEVTLQSSTFSLLYVWCICEDCYISLHPRQTLIFLLFEWITTLLKIGWFIECYAMLWSLMSSTAITRNCNRKRVIILLIFRL